MAKVTKDQEPTGKYMSVDHWERDLDPWHEDAFPAEFRHAGTKGERAEGWMGVDWCGNPIVFVPDGTEA
jgi:hypothetical protein